MNRYYSRFKGDIHEGRIYRGGGKGNQFRKVLKITKLHVQCWYVNYLVCDEKSIPFGVKRGFCDYANFQMWAREEIRSIRTNTEKKCPRCYKKNLNQGENY